MLRFLIFLWGQLDVLALALYLFVLPFLSRLDVPFALCSWTVPVPCPSPPSSLEASLPTRSLLFRIRKDSELIWKTFGADSTRATYRAQKRRRKGGRVGKWREDIKGDSNTRQLRVSLKTKQETGILRSKTILVSGKHVGECSSLANLLQHTVQSIHNSLESVTWFWWSYVTHRHVSGLQLISYEYYERVQICYVFISLRVNYGESLTTCRACFLWWMCLYSPRPFVKPDSYFFICWKNSDLWCCNGFIC